MNLKRLRVIKCLLKISGKKPAIVAQTFSPSTEEAETHKYLGDQGQNGLHSEFQATQGCIVRTPSQTKQNKNQWGKYSLALCTLDEFLYRSICFLLHHQKLNL